MLDQHFDFAWRSLRRLGVREADLDDAAQQVFIVISRKLDRSTLSKSRRSFFRPPSAWPLISAAHFAGDERSTTAPSQSASIQRRWPDEHADRKSARALLDTILDEMSVDLRAVFVLFELEELSSIQIGELLGLPTGTVASRLRRARAEFQSRIQQLEATYVMAGDSK